MTESPVHRVPAVDLLEEGAKDERRRILRALEPHLDYLRRVGYTLTAKQIEAAVWGEPGA